MGRLLPQYTSPVRHFGTLVSLLMVTQYVHSTEFSFPYDLDQKAFRAENLEPASEVTFSGILTNVRGVGKSRPEIRILDTDGAITWKWNSDYDNLKTKLPDWLYSCVSSGSSATDAKQSKDGSLIAAIYGDAIVVVKHSDKSFVWGVCAESGTPLAYSHTLELLPHQRLAIATSGQSQQDGIFIYDVSKVPEKNPDPIQKIQHHPDIHGLFWDDTKMILWAAGTNSSVYGDEIATGLIRGYNQPSILDESLAIKPVYEWLLPNPSQTYTEWSNITTYEKEWDAPHDLIPVPGQSIVLIPTDIDLHALDTASGKFLHGPKVAETYLKGFCSNGIRVGKNRKGEEEELARSDLKSISFGPNGATIHVQANWRDFFTSSINLLDKDGRKSISPGGSIYHARWFKTN